MANEWCTICPIYPQYFVDPLENISIPIEFESGVKLIHSPDWLKNEHITKDLSIYHRNTIIEYAKYAFACTYDAESLGDPVEGTTAANPISKQRAALHKLQMANIALWIAQPTNIGTNLVFDTSYDYGEWSLRDGADIGRIMPNQHYEDDFFEVDNVEKAVKYYGAIEKCKRSGPLWMAIQCLLTSTTAWRWENRYLFLWVALEALFGPDDSREMSYRISQRLGMFLGGKGEEGIQIFKKVKDCYNIRSKVVHGMRLQKLKPEESAKTLIDSELLLQKALRLILEKEDGVEIFSGNKREEYLDGLIFNL